MYKVSICVPVYGVESFIEQCVTSLFEQTYDNLEYIFVNDCTQDNSIDIIQKTLANYPTRIKQVTIVNHLKNKGLGISRNTAVSKASGRFILHVDSDDFLDKTAVEMLVNTQINTNADIVVLDEIRYRRHYREIRYHKDYKSSQEMLVSFLQKDDSVSIWGKLILSTLYKENNICVEQNVNMSEDFQVTPRLLFYASKIANVHGVYYNYNCLNSNSYTASFSIDKIKQVWRTLEVLNCFFKDKGDIYTRALLKGKSKILIDQFKSSARSYSNKKFHKEIKRKIETIDSDLIKECDCFTKVALKINNYFCLHLYVIIFSYLKRNIKLIFQLFKNIKKRAY